ncbi:VC0807 family protein [Streptomyces sp. NRRL S-350]|uniref:VC0807 family protein n=1 Tax=Streptomyces sp. NRRL S-350 TaxID=1463902 RepID=UPI000A958AEB|nr:VC0807 family protein [Streptomyces sp. NRRL S-350]
MSQTVSAAAVTATVAVTAPPKAAAEGAAHAEAPNPLLSGLRPLALDVAVPMAGYYLLHSACGLSEFAALAWSSAFPAARTLLGLLREGRLNLWSTLMLAVNLAGLALTFVTGDARLMIAKDGGLSGTVALAILASALVGRPVMSPMLMPFITKGKRERAAAWQRLAEGRAASSRAFRRYERVFSGIWGTALLAECAARVVGAFTLPVSTMAWLSTVFLIGAIVAGSLLGQAAAEPLEKLVSAEAEAPTAA